MPKAKLIVTKTLQRDQVTYKPGSVLSVELKEAHSLVRQGYACFPVDYVTPAKENLIDESKNKSNRTANSRAS